MARQLSAEEKAFYEPWWAKLRASYTEPQPVQTRLYRAFIRAAHKREDELLRIQAEEEAARLRTRDAQRKRDSRARDRAAKTAARGNP